MTIEKPLPLMVGDKAYYSLTSYDPVTVSVEVPYTADEDIQYGLEMTVADVGGTVADLDDPTWLAEHFDGMTSRTQVVEAMRREMSAMAAQAAEQQKLGKCVEALAARLRQSIPPQHLEQAREAIRMRFTQQLQAEGLTPQQFLAQSGTTPSQLEAMFARQAQQMAEGDAALSAFARERKLKVSEEEYGRLLGIPTEELGHVLEAARAAGQMDELREGALRAKAAQIVVAECDCTYEHETPEQARLRMLQMRQMQQMYEQRFGKGSQQAGPEADKSEGPRGKTGFKLV